MFLLSQRVFTSSSSASIYNTSIYNTRKVFTSHHAHHHFNSLKNSSLVMMMERCMKKLHKGECISTSKKDVTLLLVVVVVYQRMRLEEWDIQKVETLPRKKVLITTRRFGLKKTIQELRPPFNIITKLKVKKNAIVRVLILKKQSRTHSPHILHGETRTFDT